MPHARSNRADPGARTDPERGGVLSLGLLSIAVGAWTGLVVAIFRLGLAGAERLRGAFLAASHRWSGTGFAAAVCACGGAAALAAWLARRFSPYAEGSGIPEVATGPLPYGAAATWPLYAVLGVVAGLADAAYNRTLTGALALAERIDRWPVRPQAVAVGVPGGPFPRSASIRRPSLWSAWRPSSPAWCGRRLRGSCW